MKVFLIAMYLAVWCALGLQNSVGEAGSTADRQQILQLERAWVQSWVTMDVTANDRIIADYYGTEPGGKRVN
jgi:hypothetical protein